MFLKLLSFGALAILAPMLVFAHGVGQRIDLPIPLDLYLIGGAAVVALSFLVVWFLPANMLARLEDYPRMQLPMLNILSNKYLVGILQTVMVGFFILAVIAGFFGVNDSALNILPTTVWIMFSVGVTFFSALFGDIWKVLNPIPTLFTLVEPVVKKFTKSIYWRDMWGVWPAVGGFLLFRWVENVLPAAAEPRMLSWLVLLYATYSVIGMTLFGKKTWLEKGDPFAIFFSFVSKFSIIGTSLQEGKLTFHLRPPAVDLLRGKLTTAKAVFVLLMISGVTADGFFDTPIMMQIIEWAGAIGFSVLLTKTTGLVLLFGIFTLLYYGLSWFVAILVSGGVSAKDFAKSFVLSLLPIAVAYEFAHYASLLLLEGQRFVALLSDPFGKGWDIFGTAELTINYAAVNLKILWNAQVFMIVTGHVIAVLVAHALAEKYFENRDDVLASQYPMLIIMLFYTMFSLWIIAQPVVV